MDHIGIDVHKKESQLCILGAGRRAERAARPHHPRTVRRRPGRPAAGPHPPRGLDRERVGGALSGRARATRSSSPTRTSRPCTPPARRKIKTDRRGERARAEAPAGGVPPGASAIRRPRYVRGRLTVRDALVRTRTGYISVIRALLRQHGWRCRPAVPRGSAALSSPSAPAGPSAFGARPPACGDAPDQSATGGLGRADRGRRAGGRTVPRLQTVLSVGPVTAAAFVATRDDAGRFAHPSGRGLPGPGAPRVELGRGPAARADHQDGPSARAIAAGPGRGLLRRGRHPIRPPSASWAERLAARRGRFIAVVALARRLVGILYARLRDGTR